MTGAAKDALARAQAIRAHLALPVWQQFWDQFLDARSDDRTGEHLEDAIEQLLQANPAAVAELVDAALSPHLLLLLKRNRSEEFVLSVAAVRLCLEGAAFLDAVEFVLGGDVVPHQHGLTFAAWTAYRRSRNDRRSLWPLLKGPLHFGPGWLA